MIGGRPKPLRRWIRRIWIACGLGFTGWLVWNAQAHGVPASMLESSARVRVQRGSGAILFTPSRVAGDAGLIFLPGGAIDPKAYVPVVRAVAEAGFRSALVPLPYRTAATEASREDLWHRVERVRQTWGPGTRLVLGGHSRGAALAAGFAAGQKGGIDGLALVATTHPRDDDLSAIGIPVIKILGTRDCVATPAAARANASRLPPQTLWLEIPGANHAQFGSYGTQLGDCPATIGRTEQQRQLIALLTEFLEMMSAG